MAQETKYAELVAQAERAVASVKDPELRRAAFDKVLGDLLVRAAAEVDAPADAKKAATPKEAKKKQAAERGGPQAYVEELVDDGFFKKQRTIAQVKAELENRGHNIPLTSLSGPLQKLCQRRRLRRQRVTAEPKGGKPTFNYSNW